jgi:hypothetical protein
MKEYVEALKNGNGYKYICDNGHNMSKSELCDIIKEFDIYLKDLSNRNVGSNAYLEYVAENIQDYCITE